MAASSPVQFKVGEIVEYQGSSVLILSITNQLGFKRFHFINMDTYESGIAHRHELSKLEEVNMATEDMSVPNKNEQVPDTSNQANEEMPVPNVNEQVSDTSNRFVKKSEEDILEIESHTKAKTTHSATKWGVRIFKGM